MLNKRTQVLFSENLWGKLSRLSKAKKISIGQLVREAVEEKYQLEEELKKRRQAFKSILKIRPKPIKGRIDYKALINEGRKAY